jgi:hypothetical protein
VYVGLRKGKRLQASKPENTDDGEFTFSAHVQGFDDWERERKNQDIEEDVHGRESRKESPVVEIVAGLLRPPI